MYKYLSCCLKETNFIVNINERVSTTENKIEV